MTIGAAARGANQAGSDEPAPGRRFTLGLGAAAFFLAAAPMVAVLLLTDWWYAFFDLTDLTLYHQLASDLDRGLRPYLDFAVEYPMPALRLFDLPGHPAQVEYYVLWFAGLMLVALLAASLLVADTAARLWPERRTVLAVVGTFGGSVLALGAIVANRYDAVIALSIALFLWALASRRWLVAAVALGFGTALKLTPVVLLPLLLLAVEDWRARIRSGVLFFAAALGPLLLEGPAAWRGMLDVFRYHGARPLQAESVLATPLLLAHLAGLSPARTGDAFGSQFVDAPGAATMALLSGPLAAILLGAVYGLAWRARERLRREPRLQILVTAAVLLALLVAAKVLSPQFLVWLIPVAALLAPRERGLTLLLLVAFAATQVEFPSLYWEFVELRPGPVLLVASRNLVLCGALAWTMAKLARLVTPPA